MNIKRLAVTGFGLGHLPLAPGSWGSLPPVIIFVLLQKLNVSVFLTAAIMIVLAAAGCIICIKYTPVSIAATGKKDPPEVVVDEVAGQSITLLFTCAATNNPIWLTAGGSFFFFRLFDTIKPWPARRFEKFPEGWGVLADDLAAGIYAGAFFLIGLQWWHGQCGG
jgi:phosphatidylglycerophosphatase A